MKSLKVKLILVIISLVVTSSVLTVTVGLIQSFRVTDEIILTLINDKLDGANGMLRVYLEEQFGAISQNGEGDLIDESNQTIDGRFEYIDKLSENMNVVATVFKKDGADYIRVLTNITNSDGARVIGTKLDSSGEAYKKISSGSTFLGEADILGTPYMTQYTPIYSSANQIIASISSECRWHQSTQY